jgi:hypothetical protein
MKNVYILLSLVFCTTPLIFAADKPIPASPPLAAGEAPKVSTPDLFYLDTPCGNGTVILQSTPPSPSTLQLSPLHAGCLLIDISKGSQ